MTDRYGVMGHPISHTKSPFIHARFAEQTGEDLSYEVIHVDPGTFEQALASFRGEGGRGVNVTLPFKEEAWKWVSTRTERARRAGAVNTICFSGGGETLGDNTDGIGLIRDLRRLGVDLEDSKVLLIGAGGAARGVVGAILDCEPHTLAISNRTGERARELGRAFACADKVLLQCFELGELAGLEFDVVINATSASLEGTLPPLPISIVEHGRCAYDLMYSSAPTPFLVWAQANGARIASDGLGMLVEQAAESFYLWREKKPDTRPVLAALRAEMLK